MGITSSTSPDPGGVIGDGFGLIVTARASGAIGVFRQVAARQSV